jgi:putative tricarboxylic transport membrane protein
MVIVRFEPHQRIDCFTVLAYFMKKYGFPVVPMLLAIILGPQLEEQLRMSLIIAQGHPMIFVGHPISLVFIIVAVGSFVTPLIRRRKQISADEDECRMDAPR